MGTSPTRTVREHYEEADSFASAFVGRRGASLLPGGFGRSSFALAPRVPMAREGTGYWMIDEEGRRLIDLNNNFTALIHGHGQPEVTKAACAALERGASFGLPSLDEVDHARVMLERLDYMDQIRYCNSGTEAVMLAVRMSRAATGRDVVVFVHSSYHGTSDVALVTGGRRSRLGLPNGVLRDTIQVALNDVEGIAAVFAEHGERIAAVVLDPMPNRAGLIAATVSFLEAARRLCDDAGALLVSDEVVALRQAYRGCMKAAGVQPDLLVVGKIVGGGLPVGAVLGGTRVMSLLDPLTEVGMEHGGTFSGNPVTMAAGAAAMRLFSSDEVDRLNALGARIRNDLSNELASRGWEVRGAGSLFRLFRPEIEGVGAKALERTLWWAAYDRGLLLVPNGLGALSTPMDEGGATDIISRLVDAARATSG